ncbi:MAG: AMP-binding protein [Desulfuromonadaceae bacterium]|nr:AMP-binding protein [Desulfuromonadaceae bacterium]
MTHADSIPLIEQVDTLCDLVAKRIACSGVERCLWYKHEQQWVGLTWSEFDLLLSNMIASLYHAGCRAGDRIGIMAKTSILWDLCHYAILKLGGVVVGLDPHDTADNIAHIIRQAQISGVVVDAAPLCARIEPHGAVLSFVLHAEYSGAGGLRIAGAEASALEGVHLPQISAESPATIIFTSGTTGTSKGIVYTHSQVILAGRAILSRYPEVKAGAHLPCWLPLSNLFQRMLNFAGISVGAKLFYVSNPMEIVQQLPQINPAVLIGVPRFYEKVHEGILQTIARQPWLVRKLFAHCLQVRAGLSALQHPPDMPTWKVKLADLLILRKVRARVFGTRLLFVVSGSAPMPLWLLHWYQALGVLVLEAYGISENVVPIACNTLSAYRFGTVGKVIAANSVRVAEDGELLVSGSGVFQGYIGGGGAEKFTPDGYFKTGDEGRIDSDGFVTLLGRKADFFKTSTGKRVSPVELEAALVQIDAFEHVLVVGEGRKVPIILATLAHGKGEHISAVETQILREKVNTIAQKMLPVGLQPAVVVILRNSFSLADGELTSNLKLRRKAILEKYTPCIDAAYQRIAANDLSAEQVNLLEDSQGGIVRL